MNTRFFRDWVVPWAEINAQKPSEGQTRICKANNAALENFAHHPSVCVSEGENFFPSFQSFLENKAGLLARNREINYIFVANRWQNCVV